MRKPVNLGDLVRDPVTGVEGIATVRHSYLQGCDRIAIQPPMKKDGTIPEPYGVDEPQLEIVKRARVPQGSRTTGGPARYNERGTSSR
jgi:hypothetical protein